MQAFVDWVLARRHRSLMLTVLLTPVMPAAAALVTLETVHRGVGQGLLNAVAAVTAATLLEIAVEGQAVGITRITMTGFAFAIASGIVLRRTRSLAVAFQALVLLCCAGVALISVSELLGGWLLNPLLDQIGELLRRNEIPEAEIALVRAASPPLFLAVLLAQIVGGLLLGYWWLSMAAKERRFGPEFRRLALGRALGVAGSVVVTAGLAFDAPLIQNLSSLALVGFLFQGFAVLHAWAHARNWHYAVIATVYGLLVVPPLIMVAPWTMVAVILTLSAVGLIDNWFDLRAPLHAQS